jgi:hypothetical protein
MAYRQPENMGPLCHISAQEHGSTASYSSAVSMGSLLLLSSVREHGSAMTYRHKSMGPMRHIYRL